MMMCDVCRHPLSAPTVSAWTYHCTHCGLWRSTLVPSIDSREHTLSEQYRFEGLQSVRFANIDLIFDRLALLSDLKSLRLLDVGCAYGWFLESAVSREVRAVGIEPDATTAQMARSRNLDVRQGSFPQSLTPGERFDAIVFNDVLEHIPDVHAMIGACETALNVPGLLVLSVPTSAGTLFAVARVLARVGWPGPWRRLWQVTFPSPHVYYFDRGNLDYALRSHGFTRVDAQDTMVFHPKGLWARLQFDRGSSLVIRIPLFLGLLAIYPFYRLFGRADTELLIYRKS